MQSRLALVDLFGPIRTHFNRYSNRESVWSEIKPQKLAHLFEVISSIPAKFVSIFFFTRVRSYCTPGLPSMLCTLYEGLHNKRRTTHNLKVLQTTSVKEEFNQEFEDDTRNNPVERISSAVLLYCHFSGDDDSIHF